MLEPISSFPLPLKPEDDELTVDLQTIVDGVCDRAGYNQRIDYRQPVPPPVLDCQRGAEKCKLLSCSLVGKELT